MWTVSAGAWVAGSVLGSGTPLGWPPEGAFSGRGPWVTGPVVGTGVLNGSTPLASLSAMNMTMIPIDSYHEALDVS